MDIKESDIEAFGRVLRAIGELCEREPSRVVDLLWAPRRTAKSRKSLRGNVELDNLDLFEFAKGKSREELMTYFGRYDVEELRYLIRRYRFGVLKNKSWQALANHLANQIEKRQIDVFKTHE